MIIVFDFRKIKENPLKATPQCGSNHYVLRFNVGFPVFYGSFFLLFLFFTNIAKRMYIL